jgi:lipoyl-dependent peroxiredoxin
MLKRNATAHWQGSGAEGSGHISAPGGALNNTPYSVASRFVSEDGRAGTNPEELVAAAHAACFTMALSFMLTGAGHAPDSLDTKATVEMEKIDIHWKISSITLDVSGNVPGMSAADFETHAQSAKTNCPISQALSSVPIHLMINGQPV